MFAYIYDPAVLQTEWIAKVDRESGNSGMLEIKRLISLGSQGTSVSLSALCSHNYKQCSTFDHTIYIEEVSKGIQSSVGGFGSLYVIRDMHHSKLHLPLSRMLAFYPNISIYRQLPAPTSIFAVRAI
jgi:hypothetical protein